MRYGKTGMALGTVLLLALAAGARAETDDDPADGVAWPDAWVVFLPEALRAPALPVETRRTIPEVIEIDGERLEALSVTPEGDQFDMAALFGGTREGRTAYVFLSLESAHAQTVSLGLGADWWMEAWLNGEPILDTTGAGNGAWPPSIRDHVVEAPLRQGRNILSVRFVSGSGSSVLALGGPEHLRRGPAPSIAHRAAEREAEALRAAMDAPAVDRTPGAFLREFVVAPDGSDDHPGTFEAPFATIGRAAEVAGPGDRVVVRAGEYRESIVFPRSGKPGMPIVFSGERGPDGEWLTVVDPGIPVTGWVPAPEVGPGVFRTQDLPFNPGCMTLDGKHLARIADRLMERDRDAPPSAEPVVRIAGATARQREGMGGFGLLRLPADAVSDTLYVGDMPYWNGIEVLYGHLGEVTYIRFRAGDDPRERELKASPRGSALRIENRSNLVIRGFRVRGAEQSVVVTGPEAVHNTIEENCLMHGRDRVLITEGAARNVVQGNRMSLGYYGHDNPGAWGMTDHHDLAKIRCHIYQEFKHTIGPGSSDDRGVHVFRAGPDNVVRGNRIRAGLIGLSVRQTPRLRAYRNTVSHMSSIGILTVAGVVDAQIHDNLVFDCNLNFRIHHYNTPGMPRREYHYRNLSYQPHAGLGSHIYVHYDDRPWPGEPEDPEIHLYHNTYSGGRGGLSVSGYARRLGGMRRTVVVNNVFSVPGSSLANPRSWYWGIEDMFEAVDYNWLGRPGADPGGERPPWFGPNNVIAGEDVLWPAGAPAFDLPADSGARGAGLDLSLPFVLLGREHAPLPGMAPGYFDGDAPDLGAVQQGRAVGPGFLHELDRLHPDAE